MVNKGDRVTDGERTGTVVHPGQTIARILFDGDSEPIARFLVPNKFSKPVYKIEGKKAE